MMASLLPFSRCQSVAEADTETQLGHVLQHGGPSLSGQPLMSRTCRLTKLLLNVSIEGSLGPVQVLMSPENDVEDLVKAAVEIYVREKRRPLLHETDHRSFDLHYSQFSLESLKTGEKLINLGSRNFYLCKKPT